jgi:mxaJ protein
LPYSNRAEQGFENELASFVARAMHARLRYTWSGQRRGLIRNALDAGACDALIGVPLGLASVRTTRPYYRSGFAFVSRADRALGSLRSIADERLKSLRIGVPLAGDDGANPAPVMALARRGIIWNLSGFPLWVHDEGQLPPAIGSITRGETDVAVLWGPLAGAAAKKSPVPLHVQPLQEQQDAGIPFAFSIALGVRRDDAVLAGELDAVVERHQRTLASILRKAGVPLLELTTETEARHDHR